MSNSIARIIADARTKGAKLADYPGAAPADDRAAFALQCEAARLTGWHQTGWKIGCTSEMAKKMLNTSSPFPGPVYAERTVENGGMVRVSAAALRLVEPEIAFTMARNLPARGREWTCEEVIAAANEREIAMVFTGHRHFRH